MKKYFQHRNQNTNNRILELSIFFCLATKPLRPNSPDEYGLSNH